MNNRYQVSEEFKQSCKENIGLNRYGRIHAVEDNLDIVGGNYDGQLVGFTIEDGCYVEDRFIGTTVAKKIIVNILNPDNILNLENKTIEAYAGIYINGKLEEIPYGNYIIEKPDNEEVKEKTSFTGYDYMIKFNIPYKDRVKYPIKLSTLFEDVCDQVGLEAGNIDFTNADYMVLGNPFTNGEDCRTVLSNIAQLAGGFAKIGRDNKAYIISLKKQSEFAEKITANNYFEDFSKNNQWGELNSLVIGLSDIEGENTARDDKESIEKNGLTEIKIEDNYLLINEEEREKVIEPLWENLKGLKYLPFKSKYYGYPYLDSGDSIAIEDTQEVQYVSFVFNHTFTFNGAFDGNLDIPAMTKTQTAYKNTQDIKSRIKRAERKIDKVNGQIEDVIKETTENSEKLSKHEQTIDSMKDTISSVETKVETVEKAANSASSKADSAEATANSAKESAENAVSQAETTTERLVEVEKNLDGITSTVSETVKKVETIEGKADSAQQTADTANKNAQNAQKSIETTNERVSKAEQTLDGFSQTVSSVQETLETTNAKFDNLEIGGTNLVSNLEINWEQGTVGEGASAGSTYDELKQGNDAYHTKRIRTKELIPIKNQFIISFNSGYRCCFALFDSNQHYLGITDGFSHWFTTSPTLFDKNASYIAIVFSTPDNSVITPSEIEKIKVKLELGNKATDWTPAPEDTESKFENYYTKTETNSQIDQKSNQITSTVQQNITTAIDGIVIGGENLVSSLEANWEQGTLGEGANTGVTYDSVKTSNGSTTRIRTKDIIPIDSKFIVSFASGYRCCFCLFDANKKYLGQSAGFVNWFTTSPNMFDKNAKYIALCFSKDDGTSAISIKDVKNMKIKLELGTKSSGWSVAPEDYYTKSEIDQKDNQISLDVTGKVSDLEKTLNAKIDLKVDTKKLISEINASADQITLNSNRLIINSSYFTLDKNGKITATSGKIGGFTLDTTSFTGSLKGYYNYDVYDIQKLLAQCRYGDIDFPYCIRDLLDVVEDGNLNLVDASKMVDIINGKKDSDKYVTGTFKINSQNPKDCISILNGKEVIASLGLGGINAVNVSTGSLICGSTTIDDTSFEGTVISHLGIRTNKVFTYASNTAVIDGNANGVYFGQNANGGLITILRGGTVRLYAHNGGGVYLGASGSTAVTSDETQKDIYEIDDKYIEFFNKLKPITYIYKNKGHRNHIGFGARQVENALLESGLTTEQFAGILIDEDITISADEMGMEEDVHFDKLYSLRYEEFVALNTLKIQKQDKIIQKLIQRVEKLESEMI